MVLPVLPFETVDQAQTLLNLLKTVRVVFDAITIASECTRQLLYLVGQGVYRLTVLIQRGVQSFQLGKVLGHLPR